MFLELALLPTGPVFSELLHLKILACIQPAIDLSGGKVWSPEEGSKYFHLKT